MECLKQKLLYTIEISLYHLLLHNENKLYTELFSKKVITSFKTIKYDKILSSLNKYLI